jgi:hypothetical protein
MSMIALLRRLFAPGRPERAPTGSGRPKLEVLEDRAVPSVENIWVGPSGGLWSDPANWSLGHTPQSDDLLIFGLISDGGLTAANTDSVDDLPNVSVGNITLEADYTSTLTVDGGNTLTSAASFDQSAGSLVLHSGATLSAADGIILGGPTAIESGVTIASTGTLYINKSLTLAPDIIGGKAFLNAGAVYQAGTLSVAGGVELDINGFYNPIAGSLTTVFQGQATISVSSSNQVGMEGELDLNNGIFATTNGLKVDGTLKTLGADLIVGNLENNGQIVWASATPFTTLLVNGNYSTDLGTLNMRVASGNLNDSLLVSGSASLGGTLDVIAQGPLTFGNTFGLITCAAGSMTGNFSSLALPPLPSGGVWVNSILPGGYALLD